MARNTAPPIQFHHNWELLASYGPRPEIWRASSYGTVLVARRAPDGKEAVVLALISLSENGISFLAGDPAAAAGTWGKMLARLARRPDHLPAPVPNAAGARCRIPLRRLRLGRAVPSAGLQPYRPCLNILKPPPGKMQR
ncbi:MAG: hypothetical protein H5T97_01155 [Firmicutes bacterium]|nr:hypothetical protein [Bacillota bacterium]